jgi:wyosine [tRNA(Phe)-imidazoG37] synthetase (radical SAM superfamily)
MNSFVWYGDLIDLQTEGYVGTATFIITNGTLTEGVIRFSSNKTSYYISKDALTTAYYHINQM